MAVTQIIEQTRCTLALFRQLKEHGRSPALLKRHHTSKGETGKKDSHTL